MLLKSMSQILGFKQARSSEAGFLIPFLIFLLPIFITLMAWLALSLLQLKETKRDRQLCRTYLISAQDQVALNIQKLLALNFKARTLRVQMIAAKAALAAALAAGQFPQAAVARVKIRQIQVQKALLINSQKRLVWDSKAKLGSALYELQILLQKKTSSFEKKNNPLFIQKISSMQASPVRVAVVRSNSPDPFPEYELAPNFSRRQSVGLKWQSLFLQKNEGVKRWIPFDQKKQVQCGATLKERQNVFTAIPAQDKFF